jgi:hypothetical protein
VFLAGSYKETSRARRRALFPDHGLKDRDFNMQRLLSSLTLSAALAICFAGQANADVSGPFTTTTPIGSTRTDFTGNLVFQKFDSSLGTLQSVTLQIGSDLTTTLTVTNSGSSSSNGTANTNLKVTVSDPNNALFTLLNNIISDDFAYSLAQGASTQSGLITNANNLKSKVFTDATTLINFSGSGTISLNVSTLTQTLLANTGGNTSSSQVTNATVTGNVTYTYAPAVPEPTTMALMGVGGALLLVRLRRRKVQA